MIYLIDTYIIEAMIGLAASCFGTCYFVGYEQLANVIQEIVMRGLS